MSSIRRDPPHLHFPAQVSGHGRLARSRTSRGSTLSIVIPARNEAANLGELVEEIVAAFRPLRERSLARHRLERFEILVVDDGSTDETRLILDQLSDDYPELRPIFLVRSVGQSAAIVAGFQESRGDWVGLLDGDLQNPPSELVKLWDALPGHDAALGWRVHREDDAGKRWTSRLANLVRNIVLGHSIKDTGCSVRIFPREMALRLPAFHGMHRFFGSLLIREGCRVIQVPVNHRPRVHGKSHYHFGNRSVRVVIDLLGVLWLLRRPVRFEVRRSDLELNSHVTSRITSGKELS